MAGAADVLSGSQQYCVLRGKSESVLRGIPDESVDSIVHDPPAGIGFMGSEWDKDKGGRDEWILWLAGVLAEALRVAKPGAHMLVWAIPRTSHWTATAIEDAGWEIRDVITHHYGNGFPKSHNISKAIDKAAGAERPVIGDNPNHRPVSGVEYEGVYSGKNTGAAKITGPATDEAKRWDGYGTALKPASEHWILARKPLATKTIAANVVTYGTGGLNIDATRVLTDEKLTRKLGKTTESSSGWKSVNRSEIAGKDGGRWPPNLILSHGPECAPGDCQEGCVVAELDRQSGSSVSRKGAPRSSEEPGEGYGMTHTGAEYDDEGGASRFFPTFRYHYFAKPKTSEKQLGCDKLFWKKVKKGTGYEKVSKKAWGKLEPKERAEGNVHSTVKGVELMRWLCRLVTPEGGVVLDPFTGSGTTGVSCVGEFRFIGVEQDPGYAAVAKARMDAWSKPLPAKVPRNAKKPPQATQLDLLGAGGD